MTHICCCIKCQVILLTQSHQSIKKRATETSIASVIGRDIDDMMPLKEIRQSELSKEQIRCAARSCTAAACRLFSTLKMIEGQCLFVIIT